MKAETFGFIAWAALIALQPAWYLWLAPPGQRSRCPLLLTLRRSVPLRALRAVRSARCCDRLISLGYFLHGVVAAWSHPSGACRP